METGLNHDTYMKDRYIQQLKSESESEIIDKTANYTTKYYAVYHILSLTENNPEIIDLEIILAMQDLLISSEFSQQRRSLFLFRLAAETLSSVIIHSDNKIMADTAFSAMTYVMKSTTTGHAHRATSEAMSALPFSIYGPEITTKNIDTIPEVDWHEILDKNGFKASGRPLCMGRSIVISVQQEEKLLVFKMALSGDSPNLLREEALWMDHLGSEQYSFPLKFKIPVAVRIKNRHLFRLNGQPGQFPENKDIHPKRYAIGFIADKDYFKYPNDPETVNKISDHEFREVIFRNAWLLGRLASSGIIHTAPIPLFHNRVQAGRRRDNGLYEWFRAGRIDRWLDSCAFPNLGFSGLRDFEHLESFKGKNFNLYRYIGSHFLSLLLVTGSFFRNKKSDLIGFDSEGNPIDARYLFNKSFLKELLNGIFLNYYNGFVGTDFRGDLPINLNKLVNRMIEEMGVDRYMEEVFRIADQIEMTKDEYISFLREKKIFDDNNNQIDLPEQGKRDIIIQSGPHLGGFNEAISLPELIDANRVMSALCIAGKYWKKKEAGNMYA
ncbi:MAG: SidJ-related pseudokinase [Deltaproteobacteria bacterium]|nr:SidJ-related pseudokinase [Deltaproteobacteria bacterium]